MQPMYYIGRDVHKRKISYCVKDSSGKIFAEGLLPATRLDLMLRAIAAAKKKYDRIDAGKICDCLRCDFLPESYMASTAIRERRRTLRYRKSAYRTLKIGPISPFR